MSQNARSPRTHIVNIRVAVHIIDVGTARPLHKDRRPVNRLIGAHRTVDAAQNTFFDASNNRSDSVYCIFLLISGTAAILFHYFLSSSSHFATSSA